MKLLLACVFVFLFFSHANGEDLSSKVKMRSLPTCIAGFCFDQHAPMESSLTDMFGGGVLMNEGEESFRCYELQPHELFLKFSIHNDTPPFIDSILVSNKPICEKAKQPTQPFAQIKTMEGLMLGDTYEKAIRIYGIPQHVRTGKELNLLIRNEFSTSSQTMVFDKAIAYTPSKADDLLVCWLFLHNGRIEAILISVSE